MPQISLTASMRSNLLSLQNISGQVSLTQNRLATGKKVNSAIDNPSSFYTASSLNNRARDLDALLDSMGQAVATIKAATEAVDSGLGLLEQAVSITEQTLSEAKMVPMSDPVKLVDNVVELEAKGYTVVNSTTSLSDFKALLQTDNAKIVLSEDITFASTLNITGSNVTINGGGHQLKCNGIVVDGADANICNIEVARRAAGTIIKANATATGLNISNARLKNEFAGYNVGIQTSSDISIENVTIDIANTGNNRVMGILAENGSNTQISNLHCNLNSKYDCVNMGILAQTGSTTSIDGMSMTSESENAYAIIKNGGTLEGVTFPSETKGKVNYPSSWFDGEANTKAILQELGDNALAAKACNEYSVGTEADFAAGTWYLPSIGELQEMYGCDYDAMTDVYGNGEIRPAEGKNIINETLRKLEEDHHIDTELLGGYNLWSSSEYVSSYSWWLDTDLGSRYGYYKDYTLGVRSFQLVENCFNPSSLSADGTAAPKVGDVMYTDKTWSDADHYDASKTIAGVVVSVGDDNSAKIMSLTNIAETKWSTVNKDVVGVENKDFYSVLAEINPNKAISVESINQQFAKINDSSYQKQYNEVLSQYDGVMNDASYKGVNLLKNDNLNVRFNEDGSSGLNIIGKDASTQALGLSEAKWETFTDVFSTINQLREAINSIRSINNELGNNYSIVQSRENFTENLINILTEGADKLTLADMNEESANMLALQTRQQLAINSLSLASQASQSVLKLF